MVNESDTEPNVSAIGGNVAGMATLEHVPKTDTEDPTPPLCDATEEAKQKYRSDLVAYSKEMLECLSELKDMNGENLWLEFITIFRREAIEWLPASHKTKWIDLLRSRGVKLKKGRNLRKQAALLNCLNCSNFAELQGSAKEVSTDYSNATASQEFADGAQNTQSKGTKDFKVDNREPNANTGVM